MANLKQIAATLAILGSGALMTTGCKKDNATTETPGGGDAAGGDAAGGAAAEATCGEGHTEEGHCGAPAEGEGEAAGEGDGEAAPPA